MPDANERGMGGNAARWMEERELRLAGVVVEGLQELQRVEEAEVLLGNWWHQVLCALLVLRLMRVPRAGEVEVLVDHEQLEVGAEPLKTKAQAGEEGEEQLG